MNRHGLRCWDGRRDRGAGRGDGQGEVAAPGVGWAVGTVGIAIAAGSLLGYALTVAVGRLLSPAEFAVFLTFWGVLFGLGSTLSPLEQEASRLAAVARERGTAADRTVLRTLAAGAGVVAVAAAVTLLPAVRERLFPGYPALAVVVLGAAVAFAAQFVVRGLLVGPHEVGRVRVAGRARGRGATRAGRRGRAGRAHRDAPAGAHRRRRLVRLAGIHPGNE
ncbi:hypothetical protein SAMN05421810_10362 [Amycolatopsis arida]|uniref:Polysaccharide biosynthesis protein n=1 Tax=Amycolatopsis arida TaxID=587909 RepID=A0A1I5S9R5_9PSEU|nr:hypothetical protein [Amycolatopsis arida]TDX85335.1 hypothetical protein CLV69_11662 [Amycolatopsis arida]SFP67451.1 hypothetical protein SAMN05421810_10362 [Amycolatopsis arida]